MATNHRTNLYRSVKIVSDSDLLVQGNENIRRLIRATVILMNAEGRLGRSQGKPE